jgi:hypothetical protein
MNVATYGDTDEPNLLRDGSGYGYLPVESRQHTDH